MKTHNSHPQWYNQPLRLNEDQLKNPALIFDDFFQCYHLNEVRQTMWQWLVAVVSSAGSVSDDHHERNNHMYFYEKMEALVEGVWIMRQGSAAVPAKPAMLPNVDDTKAAHHTRYSKPMRRIEKAHSHQQEVINEVFADISLCDLHEFLLPNWIRVAIVNSESPYTDGDERAILYEFYDHLLIFIEGLYMLSAEKADYQPVYLNEEQIAEPALAVAAFFQQFSLEYIRRELCDFLDAGIGYDGNYPNDFSPWLAWMAYNHVLCMVEAGGALCH